MKTILICDDERHMVRLIQHTLAPNGHRILTATTGPEAMAAMRAQKIDLLILDVMLPGQDGFAVLEEMQKEPGEHMPQVVMLTARGLNTTREQATAFGVSAFVTKPFSPIELQRTVAHLLG